MSDLKSRHVMQGHLTIWVSPGSLRAASERVATLLESSEFDVLYLNLQRDLERILEELVEGVPYQSFIDRLLELKLITEPIRSWEYAVKPIVAVVRDLKRTRPYLRVWCYRQPIFAHLSARMAEEIARMILRSSLTGKIDVKEWRNLLTDFVEASEDALWDEANYIVSRFDHAVSSLCISDFHGRDLVEGLKRSGINVNLEYIFLPYFFTPLEILAHEFGRRHSEGSELSDNRISDLVKCHKEFVREYVLTSEDNDEAYFRWIRDNVKWLRPRLNQCAATRRTYSD